MAPGHQIELRNCCKKKASNCQIGTVHQRQNPEKSVMRTSDVAPACPPKLQRRMAPKELPDRAEPAETPAENAETPAEETEAAESPKEEAPAEPEKPVE